MTAKGPAVVPTFEALGNAARSRGFRVFVEDPAALAAGDGSIEIELPDIEDAGEAREIVQGLIDEVPGAAGTYTIVESV